MKRAKFSFKLESKGRLANVFFYPENKTMSIRLTSEDRKTWENDEFELLVEDPFDYLLEVYAISGTEWKAQLDIIDDDGESKKFLSWSGVTGDTSRNTSERTKPVKNLP